jgi:hypothetical protein
MPRRRARKPLRPRVVYYIADGTRVLQSDGRTWADSDPLFLTVRRDAQRLADARGGTVHRLTKFQRFKTLKNWWE